MPGDGPKPCWLEVQVLCMYPEMPVTRSAGKESGTSPRHPRARILGTPLSKALAVLEGILQKVTM